MTNDKKNKSIDLFGIAPYGEGLSLIISKSFEGIESFLKAVCMPALSEVGLMLKDKVSYWRLNNVLRILEKAKGKLEFSEDKLQIKSHPRIALSIIENGSVIDDDELQELWAGLFASSCNSDGQDDENLIFVDILKRLTLSEARIIKYSCESGRKIIYQNGLIMGEYIEIHLNELIKLTGVKDLYRIDRELDHLGSLNLFRGGVFDGSGFVAGDNELIANITPSALALNFFMRTQGFNGSPQDFWKKQLITEQKMTEELEENEKLAQEKMRIL